MLEAAREHLQSRGRMIVEVRLDGRTIPAGELDDRRGTSISEVEVRLYSAEPRELAALTLRQARLQLSEASTAQVEAAELLQQDEPSEALARIGLAMGAWQHAQQAVLRGSQLVELNLDELTFDHQPVTKMVSDLLEQFQTLKQLITRDDTLGLADALAYEWPETTDRWDRLMEHLAIRIEERTERP